ncbi:MAG TPA: hypothetical protein VLS45_04190 [Methylomicrobium sp.]|nr:hypothetical protein [Methylomicrobium sp.]
MAKKSSPTGNSAQKKTIQGKSRRASPAKKRKANPKPVVEPKVISAKNALKGLVIRSGAVREIGRGTLLACDPRKEARGIPHVIALKWQNETFTRVDAKFDARSACFIEGPERLLLTASSQGTYSLAGHTGGNIFRDIEAKSARKRYGDIRSLGVVAGTGYAVGYQGSVYRFDRIEKKWTIFDEGLPSNFDIEAIDGFGENEIYVVGFKGQVWQFDGSKWLHRPTPTEVNLNAIKCGGNGIVYLGGSRGELLAGRKESWVRIEHEITRENIWDLEWFEGALYVSTMLGVFRLDANGLKEVDFGADEPSTTYHLSEASGVLWSIGSDDVMSFDGRFWTRIV